MVGVLAAELIIGSLIFREPNVPHHIVQIIHGGEGPSRHRGGAAALLLEQAVQDDLTTTKRVYEDPSLFGETHQSQTHQIGGAVAPLTIL